MRTIAIIMGVLADFDVIESMVVPFRGTVSIKPNISPHIAL